MAKTIAGKLPTSRETMPLFPVFLSGYRLGRLTTAVI